MTQTTLNSVRKPKVTCVWFAWAGSGHHLLLAYCYYDLMGECTHTHTHAYMDSFRWQTVCVCVCVCVRVRVRVCVCVRVLFVYIN